MNNRTLDFVLAVGAIVIGIMLLSGKGAIFMGGGDAQKRRKQYDQKKMEKASGVAMIVIGIATGIDSYTTGMFAKIGYTVFLVLVLIALVAYFKMKCKKQ
ncbi:MAG: DUF3784 domain-containing protein [Blautia sp.]|nr:DUF3784 domain-containing protein [Blautia sp.]MDY3998305.1 DUF3784 domain-containing protein [Blautia sp.]